MCAHQVHADRQSMPNVVNTQLVNPIGVSDVSVATSFVGVGVSDWERANVRPANPSLCIGNGFVIEVTDLVSCIDGTQMHCACCDRTTDVICT